MTGRVFVKIVGYASDVFDKPAYEIDTAPGLTMRELFIMLSRRAKPGYNKAVYDVDTGLMNEYLAVFINSREIRSLEGLDTKLKDGDMIVIMPPMAGGVKLF